MQYWDTSALLKLYVREHDSEFFRDLMLHSNMPATTSVIAETEIAAALLRKEFNGHCPPERPRFSPPRFRLDCAQERIRLIPCVPLIALQSERLARLALKQTPRFTVRSLDLIHAASASYIGALSFVATDMRLRDLSASPASP